MAQASAADAGTIEIGGDLTVNRLGFGAMRITGDGIWGDPPDRERAQRRPASCRRLGASTFIDTANSYGPDVSEELIGEALRPYAAELVIGTKGGLVRPGPDVWEPNGRPEHLRHELEGSLSRLGVQRIDLHQFHRPDPDVPLAESIGALAELKAEGKIRHIGICNADEDQLREAMSITPIVSLQNRYNLDDRRSESLVDLCEEEGVAFLPWAPIQGYEGNTVLAGSSSTRRGHGPPGGAGLAAGPLPADAADPGHRLGRPPRREHRRRDDRAHPRRGRRPHRSAA